MALALFIEGVFMILSFLLGKGISIKLPKKETKIDEQKNRENEILRTMLENIDAYDGTGRGQKDIPYE